MRERMNCGPDPAQRRSGSFLFVNVNPGADWFCPVALNDGRVGFGRPIHKAIKVDATGRTVDPQFIGVGNNDNVIVPVEICEFRITKSALCEE